MTSTSTSNNYMLSDAESFATYDIKAGEPIHVNYIYTFTLVSTVSSYNTGAGMMVRLLTAGATAFSVQGELQLYRAVG